MKSWLGYVSSIRRFFTIVRGGGGMSSFSPSFFHGSFYALGITACLLAGDSWIGIEPAEWGSVVDDGCS